ncbi:TrmH family RNA methyltransferase [Mycoplasmoides gallisepticum]|uniref:TrmH family RNA methyltransferase n=1 Tax=Mycoplasmoides gallisepticum TaxID=2096 RepID=UPI002B418341|nr:TrmH family RNA methyltransferase [Mycoplasmoides gallisepticum]
MLPAEIDANSLTISFNEFRERIKEQQEGIIVVLDQIQDPGNFGGILRTCLAANVFGVIFKKDNQARINNTVIKTSLGACFYLIFNWSCKPFICQKRPSRKIWILILCFEFKQWGCWLQPRIC